MIAMCRRLVSICVMGVLALAIATPAGAAGHASLDPTFGLGKGWVATSRPGQSMNAYGNAVGPDGKIVVVGQAFDVAGNSQIVVARYLRSGRLDRTFGRAGIFITAFPAAAGPFIATSIAMQRKTGKWIVAGGYGQGAILVMRLTSRGRLDHTFGVGNSGMTVTDVGGFANSVAVAPGGRIYVGSSNSNVGGRPMVVARYTVGGRLDKAFGVDGVVQLVFWDPTVASSSGIMGLAVAANGTLTGAGHIDYIGGDGHGSAGIFRLARLGQPIRTFGVQGHVEVAFQTGSTFASWFPCAMVVDSSGSTTVVGDGNVTPAGDIMAVRLKPTGRPNASFGNAGAGHAVIQGASDGQSTTCGAAPTASGGLTVGVETSVAQLTSRGRPDRAFAPYGYISVGNPAGVSIQAVARYGTTRFVTAGASGNTVSNLYVARYRQLSATCRSVPRRYAEPAIQLRGC